MAAVAGPAHEGVPLNADGLPHGLRSSRTIITTHYPFSIVLPGVKADLCAEPCSALRYSGCCPLPGPDCDHLLCSFADVRGALEFAQVRAHVCLRFTWSCWGCGSWGQGRCLGLCHLEYQRQLLRSGCAEKRIDSVCADVRQGGS